MATNKEDECIAQKENKEGKSYLAEIIYAVSHDRQLDHSCYTAASLPVGYDVGGSMHRKSWSASQNAH